MEVLRQEALRVLRGQHATEELRVRQGPAGQLSHNGLLESGQLRHRPFAGLQAQWQSPGILAVVGRGVPGELICAALGLASVVAVLWLVTKPEDPTARPCLRGTCIYS